MSITRLQFFARMRKLGYSKSRMQMTRIGLTYVKEEDGSRVTVTVPKHHESTFHKIAGRETNWGTPVDTKALGLEMFEVCLGLCSGGIEMVRQPLEGHTEGGPAR